MANKFSKCNGIFCDVGHCFSRSPFLCVYCLRKYMAVSCSTLVAEVGLRRSGRTVWEEPLNCFGWNNSKVLFTQFCIVMERLPNWNKYRRKCVPPILVNVYVEFRLNETVFEHSNWTVPFLMHLLCVLLISSNEMTICGWNIKRKIPPRSISWMLFEIINCTFQFTTNHCFACIMLLK